jgi:hypothetical protein
MDIRVAAYSPAAASNQPTLAARNIQPASTYIPVTATAAVRPVQSQQVANAGNDGYTDSVRGSIINILA